jgi:hypothetical protein
MFLSKFKPRETLRRPILYSRDVLTKKLLFSTSQTTSLLFRNSLTHDIVTASKNSSAASSSSSELLCHPFSWVTDRWSVCLHSLSFYHRTRNPWLEQSKPGLRQPYRLE